MLMEGFGLMIVGMTVVFCFLTLLVWTMYLSATFFKRFAAYFPDPPTPAVQPSNGITPEIVAAITAVYAYTRE